MQRKRLILCRISGIDSGSRVWIGCRKERWSSCCWQRIVNYFMFEGASELPFFIFLDNKKGLQRYISFCFLDNKKGPQRYVSFCFLCVQLHFWERDSLQSLCNSFSHIFAILSLLSRKLTNRSFEAPSNIKISYDTLSTTTTPSLFPTPTADLELRIPCR